MNSLIIPLLVPFVTAIVLALVNGHYKLEKIISLVSTIGLTLWVFKLTYYVDTHGIQACVLGGWAAPWGIAFVADRLACIMLCLSCGVGAIALAYTCWTATEKQQKYFFYPLFQVLLMGCNWAFITGDLFNLFVSYEVMLIGSYGLMMCGASKEQVRQTMKYIAINSIGSTLFVVACGVIYATTGALNMAELASRTAAMDGAQAAMVTASSMVLLCVFAMKTAAWPMFFWLPDSYPIVPSGMNGFYAGLLTKVGVYSMLRVFGMVFQQPGNEFALHVILVLSGFTMLLGVMGAMCQWEIRKILSWHIISQVGYMVMGIGLSGHADPVVVKIAIAGTIFYIVHHIVVKSCLFLVSGICERVTGTQKLKEMGGVIELAPGVAGLFLVASFSLAGMPPFSGFLAKLVLIRAGIGAGSYMIVAVAIITGFFTLYSMTKIWSYAFWRDRARESAGPNYRGMMIPTGILVAFTIMMGVWGQPFMSLAERAAVDIDLPDNYINAVMSIEPSDDGGAHHATTTPQTTPELALR